MIEIDLLFYPGETMIGQHDKGHIGTDLFPEVPDKYIEFTVKFDEKSMVRIAFVLGCGPEVMVEPVCLRNGCYEKVPLLILIQIIDGLDPLPEGMKNVFFECIHRLHRFSRIHIEPVADLLE